ncbi:variant SH3 domain-containing protein [Ditylenchus destructor]|nr:variant SH3 domain-containing protein [Ditylenchus destructor]
MRMLPSFGWAKLGVLLVGLVWIFVLIFLSNGVFRQENTDASRRAQAQRCDQLNSQLERLTSEYQSLKDENDQLKKLTLARNFQPADMSELIRHQVERSEAFPDHNLEKLDPMKVAAERRLEGQLYSKDHELSRRKLDNLAWETYFYLNSQLEKLSEDKKVDRFKQHIKNQMISLLSESAAFGSTVDKAEEWHRKALAKLTDRIQNTLYKLQHPADCSKAKILLCDLNKGCGFGCQLHHVTYCLTVAAAAQRTMILERDGNDWRYSHHGWKAAFKPITNCSFDKEVPSAGAEPYTGLSQTARIVRLPIVDGLSSRPEHLPLSFPKQFADILLTHHSNPPVFFVAQFLSYLMHDNQQMRKIVAEAEAKIPFDKAYETEQLSKFSVGTEAAFHSVDEYIKWTELYFQIHERRIGLKLKRRIFVATDDPQAVADIKEKYREYEVYVNDGIAQTAQLSNRYTDASLIGVVTDIRVLSKCNYLVCTFSSQVCRMGYELMQPLQGDAANNFHSLDDIYYFGGQLAHDQTAMDTYKAEDPEEIDMEPGDTIGIAGNHWDGFSKGTNRRTGKNGLYPSYMAKEKWRIVDFPIFNN